MFVSHTSAFMRLASLYHVHCGAHFDRETLSEGVNDYWSSIIIDVSIGAHFIFRFMPRTLSLHYCLENKLKLEQHHFYIHHNCLICF